MTVAFKRQNGCFDDILKKIIFQFLEQQCHIKCDECDIKCNKINTWVNVFKGTKNNILELTKCCGVLKTNVKTLKNDLASTQKTTQK